MGWWIKTQADASDVHYGAAKAAAKKLAKGSKPTRAERAVIARASADAKTRFIPQRMN
jgi:hypothetical protein